MSKTLKNQKIRRMFVDLCMKTQACNEAMKDERKE